jgi:hypothetical protein
MPTASQLRREFFSDRPRRKPGEITTTEAWWVERQEALEQAGYMLRPRYRPGWTPSWAGTSKFYQDFEDGQSLLVSVDTRYIHPRVFGIDDVSATIVHRRN